MGHNNYDFHAGCRSDIDMKAQQLERSRVGRYFVFRLLSYITFRVPKDLEPGIGGHFRLQRCSIRVLSFYKWK